MAGKECNGTDNLRSRGHGLSRLNKVMRVEDNHSGLRNRRGTRWYLVTDARSGFTLLLWERLSLCGGNMSVCLSLAIFSNPQMGRHRKGRWLAICRMNGEKGGNEAEAECG